MQCVNCDFENMPGISACARCGSTLAFGDICVEPPRASRHRVRTRLMRWLHPVRDRVRSLRPSVRRLSLLMPDPVSLPALLWSIVPGLGHLKTSKPRLGWFILSLWLGLLLLTVLSLGTAWQLFFWNGMIMTHVLAIVSLFAASLSYERLLVRALFGLVVFAALHLLLYRPVTYVFSRGYVLFPVPRIGANEVTARGDVLLYEGPWLRPEAFRRGDLVAYQVNAYQGGGYYIAAGFGLDRIVATSGDHVQAVDGALYVNGEPLSGERGPLAALPVDDFELDVRSEHYMILPTCLELRLPAEEGRNREMGRRLLESASMVHQEDVLGRIVFRLRPLKRFGSVR